MYRPIRAAEASRRSRAGAARQPVASGDVDGWGGASAVRDDARRRVWRGVSQARRQRSCVERVGRTYVPAGHATGVARCLAFAQLCGARADGIERARGATHSARAPPASGSAPTAVFPDSAPDPCAAAGPCVRRSAACVPRRHAHTARRLPNCHRAWRPIQDRPRRPQRPQRPPRVGVPRTSRPSDTHGRPRSPWHNACQCNQPPAKTGAHGDAALRS